MAGCQLSHQIGVRFFGERGILIRQRCLWIEEPVMVTDREERAVARDRSLQVGVSGAVPIAGVRSQ
jgi:hypothetical protein